MSNFECLTAQSGNRIICYDSRPLCTKRDPLREAQQWIEKVYQPAVPKSGKIVILGAGAGYHLYQLLAQTFVDKVYVIEPVRELREFVATEHKSVLEKICFLEDSDGLAGQYWEARVIAFRPAIQWNRELYYSARDRFVCRSFDSIEDFILHNQLGWKIPTGNSREGLVSVKSLQVISDKGSGTTANVNSFRNDQLRLLQELLI